MITVPSKQPAACVIIIGNEILSGRTQDKNLNYIALGLTEAGIRLAEAKIIPDIEQEIIDNINIARAKYDYVFTSGGIGPTHDDITSASIAKAFKVKLILHPEAVVALKKHYNPENLNEARLKMAYVPEGASLIQNPVSAAPGFIIENLYVMAGVPSIMRAMFDYIKPGLKGGPIMHSHTISVFTTEGKIAKELSIIQSQFPNVEIGSYPFIKAGKLGVSLVARSLDEKDLEICVRELEKLIS